MVSIAKDTGLFMLGHKPFPHIVRGPANEQYSHTTYKNIQHSQYSLNLVGYYRNGRLKEISISLAQRFLEEFYKPNSPDFRDPITPYTDFCSSELDRLATLLIGGKKRNFNWGKIRVVIDPRVHEVFLQIKYSKLPM